VSHREALPQDEGEIMFALDLQGIPKKVHHPMTPYQVLRMLPKDATPAQQDSAIQAWFQPGEIHYSEKPDTLHLPGHGVGKSLLEVNIPQYYRESFFSKSKLLKSELGGGRYGVAGDPVPYSVRNDDLFTGLLLLCFILAMTAFAHSRRFVSRQLKNFFYPSHSTDSSTLTETSGEVRFQFFFVLQTCLLLAIAYFFYTTHYVADTFILNAQYQVIGIFFGVFLLFFMLKAGLYTIVNNVFFDSKKNLQWMKTLLFVISAEGVLLFPCVMLLTYFNLSMQSVLYYFVIVLFFVKLLTFYKCWTIFLHTNGVFLQIILYFCALEIIPLLSLWGVLGTIVNELKINF
jgi:hypothetical protein